MKNPETSLHAAAQEHPGVVTQNFRTQDALSHFIQPVHEAPRPETTECAITGPPPAELNHLWRDAPSNQKL